jgi:hypothetical protein
MANTLSGFPIFNGIDKNTIDLLGKRIIQYLKNYEDFFGFNTSEIEVLDKLLGEVIERVEKHRIYYYIFYDGHEMDLLSEVAFYCYWIAKLHPFHLPKTDSNVLNSKIALWFFTGSVNNSEEYKISGDSINKLYTILKDLKYFSETNEEPFILLAKSFVTAVPKNRV